jgi:hypothetical protein
MPPPSCARQVGFQLVVFQRMALLVLGDEAADEVAQVHVFGAGGFAPGQAEHVLDDAVHAMGLLVDDLQQAAVGLGDVAGFLQQLGGVADRRQRVADLVGQAGREAPQRRQGQRFRAARRQRGIVQEHQHLVAAGQQPGEARQDFGQAGGQLQRYRLAVAVLLPALQAPGQLRCGGGQGAPTLAGTAQLQHRRLVGQADLAVAFDQQHAGAHAPDDQLVDLGHVGDLAAALLGQGLAVAHLPADDAGQGGDGEIAHREHQDLGQRSVAAVPGQQGPEVLADQGRTGQGGDAQAPAQRQQQGGGADIEEQHHRDAGHGIGQGMHGQQRCGDVQPDPGQHHRPDMPVPAREEQQTGTQQIDRGDRRRHCRMAGQATQPDPDRAEHDQAQQCRFQHPVQAEEMQFAADRGLGEAGAGRGHRPEYARCGPRVDHGRVCMRRCNTLKCRSARAGRFTVPRRVHAGIGNPLPG